MSFHQTHHHYDHFVFNRNSIDQAAMTAPCENEISLIPLEWLDDSRSLVLPPQGLNLWEDAVLPTHKPNRWEDSQHELVSYHHMHSNMGRTLDLPPHELNHGEVHLSSIRAITLVNHSSGGSSVVWMSSHSNAANPTSCPYGSIKSLLHRWHDNTK